MASWASPLAILSMGVVSLRRVVQTYGSSGDRAKTDVESEATRKKHCWQLDLLCHFGRRSILLVAVYRSSSRQHCVWSMDAGHLHDLFHVAPRLTPASSGYAICFQKSRAGRSPRGY